MASGSKPNASEELGSLWKLGSVRWVGRVARTPWKRRLGSEEARHPAEDEAWVMKWREPPGVSELNQMVFGLSAAKSDWGGSQSSDPGSRFVRS